MATGKRVLILGGTGCVGRALARVWPAEVPVLWQYRPGAARPDGESLCWDMLAEPAPDLSDIAGIVQLAGGTGAAALAVTTPLAEAACDLGARLSVPVLVASSQAVYGAASGALAEDAPCDPHTDYGRAKLAMERAVAPRALCLRIGNVAGCDMLLRNAARGRVVLDRLAGGGAPARAYIGPVELARALIALIGQGGGTGVLNLAQPGLVGMQDLLAAAGCDWDWREAGAGVLPALALDLGALAARLPLLPATPDGLVAQARAAGWAPA